MMRRVRRFWVWLHEPPDGPVDGWSAQWALALWTCPTIVVAVLSGAIFGMHDLGLVVVLACSALCMRAWWLRIGRHYHPVEDFRVWRSR
jgi:hypothetical protein